MEWHEDEATHRVRRGPGRILFAGPSGCFGVLGGGRCWEAAEWAAGSGVSALAASARPFWALNMWGLAFVPTGTENQLVAEGQGSADCSPTLTPGGWDVPRAGSEEGLAHPEPGVRVVGPGPAPAISQPYLQQEPMGSSASPADRAHQKLSAGWVVPPRGTNRLTLSTPLVFEGPSMQ